MKKLLLLSLLLALVSCKKDKTNNNTPTPDVSTDGTTEIDSGTDSTITQKRVLERHVPFDGLNVSNRLEDPNFGMQNESWTAFDGANNTMFMRRAFSHDTPEDRPYAGVLPTPSTPSCMLGRLKWGKGDATATVWLSYDSGLPASQVNLIGLSIIGAPEWQAISLAQTGDTAEHDGKTWQKYAADASPHFGWGFFEICNDRDEVLWVGAPTVLDATLTNALQFRPSRAKPVNARQLDRIEAFESWRRKSSDERQQGRRPR